MKMRACPPSRRSGAEQSEDRAVDHPPPDALSRRPTGAHLHVPDACADLWSLSFRGMADSRRVGTESLEKLCLRHRVCLICPQFGLALHGGILLGGKLPKSTLSWLCRMRRHSRCSDLFRLRFFILSEAAVTEALQTRGMFNLIEVGTGDKADFWMLTDEPFDLARFEHRITEEVCGIQLSVSRPEDTILAKLWWAKSSGVSGKHIIDALRVYEVRYEKLDRGYLAEWPKRSGIEALWRRIVETAEVL